MLDLRGLKKLTLNLKQTVKSVRLFGPIPSVWFKYESIVYWPSIAISATGIPNALKKILFYETASSEILKYVKIMRNCYFSTHLRNWTFLAKLFAHKSLLYIFLPIFNAELNGESNFWISVWTLAKRQWKLLGGLNPRSTQIFEIFLHPVIQHKILERKCLMK